MLADYGEYRLVVVLYDATSDCLIHVHDGKKSSGRAGKLTRHMESETSVQLSDCKSLTQEV